MRTCTESLEDEERGKRYGERRWRARVDGETLAGSKGDEEREERDEKKVKASASPVFMESDPLFGNFTSSNIMQILGVNIMLLNTPRGMLCSQ